MDFPLSPVPKVQHKSSEEAVSETPVSALCELAEKQLLTVPDAVELARSWLGTPYVLGGRVRGAGCDCATLLAEYLIGMGAASREDLEDLGIYSHNWFCHTSSERYLLGLMRHARKAAEGICRGTVVEAGPGCLMLFRVAGSRVYNHGAIVTEWPRGIHACDPCVQEVDLTKHWLTGHQQMDVFDPWAGKN